jgi:hypothetical protein
VRRRPSRSGGESLCVAFTRSVPPVRATAIVQLAHVHGRTKLRADSNVSRAHVRGRTNRADRAGGAQRPARGRRLLRGGLLAQEFAPQSRHVGCCAKPRRTRRRSSAPPITSALIAREREATPVAQWKRKRVRCIRTERAARSCDGDCSIGSRSRPNEASCRLQREPSSRSRSHESRRSRRRSSAARARPLFTPRRPSRAGVLRRREPSRRLLRDATSDAAPLVRPTDYLGVDRARA